VGSFSSTTDSFETETIKRTRRIYCEGLGRASHGAAASKTSSATEVDLICELRLDRDDIMVLIVRRNTPLRGPKNQIVKSATAKGKLVAPHISRP